MVSWKEAVIRLILSAIIGGSIGIEREVSNRPAGLRTHILVSVGSTLIMLVSIDGAKIGADPSRIAAQVVSGIGFLGAGTILRTGDNVKGLTTAASLWICAGIGLAIGSGNYLGGVVTAVIVLLSLVSLGSVEKKVFKRSYKLFEITGIGRPGLIGDIGTILGRHYITIKDIAMVESDEEDEENRIMLHLTVKTPANIDMNPIFRAIYKINGVENLVFDNMEIDNNLGLQD